MAKQITVMALIDKVMRILRDPEITHIGASDCLPILEEAEISVRPDDTHDRPRQYRREDVQRAVDKVIQEQKALIEAQRIIAEQNKQVAPVMEVDAEEEEEETTEAMPESVWTVLRNAGFNTIEEVEAFVAEGNEVSSIRGLGPKRQDVLTAFLATRCPATVAE